MRVPIPPTKRWQITIPGQRGHAVFVDPQQARLLVSDGWGVSFASLRLRALACEDGRELASARLGNAARALAVAPDGSLLAATDTKLFMLDRETLAETARWTTRIPRYTDEMLVAGGFAHLATRSRATLHAIDLASGTARRKEAGELARLHKLDDATFLVAAGVGRLTIARAGLARAPELIATTPAFCDSALDDRGRAWLSLGVAREQSADGAVGPGTPTSKLARVDVAAPSTVQELDLGLPFWQVAVSRDGALLYVIAVTPRDHAHEGPPRRTDVATFRTSDFERVAWQRMPEGFEVQTVSPELGLGWATRVAESPGEGTSELLCFALLAG